jgi:membrane-bound metal-dependent hydrolase YbcI (DUF457 family)
MGPAHFGVGFAAKAVAPKAPLWSLLVASEVLDLLSFGFIALGIEKVATSQTDFNHGIQTITPGSIPWSHGLVMSIVWSLIVAGIAYLISKNRRTSIVLGLVVFSHWVLDFIVHPPDLPLLFEGSPVVGLGLWTSGSGLIASVILEFVLLGGGVAIYIAWRRKEKQGSETALPSAASLSGGEK